MKWPLLGCMLLVFLWPNIALWHEQELTEVDLIVISSKYVGLGAKFLRHVVAEALIMALLFAPLFCGSILGEGHRTGVLAASIMAVFGAMGWEDAWFAYNLGVYPAAKYNGSRTRYTYSATGKVRKVARYQLGLTSTIVGIAAVYLLSVVFG